MHDEEVKLSLLQRLCAAVGVLFGTHHALTLSEWDAYCDIRSTWAKTLAAATRWREHQQKLETLGSSTMFERMHRLVRDKEDLSGQLMQQRRRNAELTAELAERTINN